jgi:type III pantothenate kinase
MAGAAADAGRTGSGNLLLAVDVGNTNTVLGVFAGKELKAHWRLTTHRDGTADEFGILVRALFEAFAIPLGDVRAVIVASVVPPLEGALEAMCRQAFGRPPLWVGPGIKTGLAVLYDSPGDVGADRIVNAVAAFEQHGGPCIVVDFGTATTVDAISAKGEYLGGAIAPGIGISAEALFQRAAKLPRVDVAKPKAVIGRNTVSSIQAGLFYGYLGLVGEIVRRMKQELGGQAVVVATGGLSHLILADAEFVDRVDPLLTLTGLRILFERNPAR